MKTSISYIFVSEQGGGLKMNPLHQTNQPQPINVATERISHILQRGLHVQAVSVPMEHNHFPKWLLSKFPFESEALGTKSQKLT